MPVALKAKPEIVKIDTTEPLKVECRHFIDCIVNKKIPKTDGYEGLRVLRVLSAAARSLSLGGRKISLNEK